MTIYFLLLLFVVAAARTPTSGYGEPKPIETYTPQPKAYEPVVYHKVPDIEYTKPSHGGIFATLKDKISSKHGAKHGAKHSKHGRLPFLLGFKLGAILI